MTITPDTPLPCSESFPVFVIDRADNCIWLVDPRDGTPARPTGHQGIHFTPDQAKGIGEALVRATEHGAGYRALIAVHNGQIIGEQAGHPKEVSP